MNIEKCIEQIIDNGNLEDMRNLSEMLEDTMKELKKYDEKKYKENEMKLYKMAYGSNLSVEMAEEIVRNMRPYGTRWSLEETREIQNRTGLMDIRDTDFFVVINSAYNDYKDLFNEDMDMYIRFTRDFIEDEDAKRDKVFEYFTKIANS